VKYAKIHFVLRSSLSENYERAHYDQFGLLRKKELNREQDIIKALKCKFIRIHAYDKNNFKFEIIT
jgi:hypothetical protein